ncbi:ribonuclease HI [Candidatus Scalindua japonica]|uniref:Ribonuclease H n=1 Tax=Candidatus Scalindua japonica TaxID=1284222 RepID=A0A286U2P7_9BACT|nr:ribonuclease H family protein [Candidatus Scalindua japonica]GAX62395.1 ribonuclease HI [Candidatus Scalindua japonica]
MPKKYYVVWVGRETGVFTSWAYTRKLIDKFPQAKYKSFKTRDEADTAYTTGRYTYGKNMVKGEAKASTIKTQTAVKSAAAKPPDMPIASSKSFSVNIYCDGACDPNPGEAGSGLSVYRDGKLSELWYGLYNSQGTNNSAELNALHQALTIAKGEIENGKDVQILCDSRYAIDCITNWAFSWKKKGWKRKKDGDIKNLEIIQQAHELYNRIRNNVLVLHVQAHIGIEGNELADRMSVFGIDQQAQSFCRYSDIIDKQKILAFRTG